MTTSVFQDGNTPPDGATAPKLTSKDRRRVAFASTIGTTIEFYDFYIYATAAVAVFPLLFFPATEDPTVALLQSFATFGLAFVARPLEIGRASWRERLSSTVQRGPGQG